MKLKYCPVHHHHTSTLLLPSHILTAIIPVPLLTTLLQPSTRYYDNNNVYFFPECGYISTHRSTHPPLVTLFCYNPLSKHPHSPFTPLYLHPLTPRDNRDVGAQIYREHEISQGSHNNDPARHETALVFLSVINFVTSDGITKEGRDTAIYAAATQRTSECFIFRYNNSRRRNL